MAMMMIVNKKVTAGFSLIEVLIAIVILSIGLLGIAALQVSSIQNNQNAYFRSIASIQAYDMVDRMKSNMQGVNSGLYNDLSGIPDAIPGCDAASECSTSDLVQMDIGEWNTQNAQLLPSGQGTVTGAGANSIYTIRVMWDDERSGVSGTGCDPDDEDDLKCFELSVQL